MISVSLFCFQQNETSNILRFFHNLYSSSLCPTEKKHYAWQIFSVYLIEREIIFSTFAQSGLFQSFKRHQDCNFLYKHRQNIRDRNLTLSLRKSNPTQLRWGAYPPVSYLTKTLEYLKSYSYTLNDLNYSSSFLARIRFLCSSETRLVRNFENLNRLQNQPSLFLITCIC